MVAFSDMEHVILEENCWSGLFLAYWVKRMTRAQFAIMSQRKTQTNAESFTLTAKLNAVFWACVQNEVTGIHKFYRREIWFIERIYASFSYELRARISLNWFKLQGCEKPEVTLFLRLTAVNTERGCRVLFQENSEENTGLSQKSCKYL